MNAECSALRGARLPAATVLQREILILKPGKILRLIPGRRALEGIIPETPAFMIFGDEALFATEHLAAGDLACMYAVGAELGDIFAKQHMETSRIPSFLLL